MNISLELSEGEYSQLEDQLIELSGLPLPDPANDSWRAIVRWIYEQLRSRRKENWSEQDFTVITDNGFDRSSTMPGLVRIGTRDKTYQNVPPDAQGRAIWDLVHEFGHVLIGDPYSTESEAQWGLVRTSKREKNAWRIGWTEITKQFPHLTSRRTRRSFVARRKWCLRNYDH